MRALLVFEGGGARGVAHVGAMRAFEKMGVEVRGWAGTSAGAIVAALGCVGYKSDELVGQDGSPAFLDAMRQSCEAANKRSRSQGRPPLPVCNSLTDLLGAQRWALLMATRRAAKILENRWVRLALIFAFAALVALVIHGAATGGPHLRISAAVLAVAVAVAAGSVWALWTGWWSGIVGLARFRRCLNILLSLKLEEKARRADPDVAWDHDAPVTFAELRVAGLPPLKIVATDITNGAVRVFSAETTPEVGVAAAVSASICLPLVFRPVEIVEASKGGDSAAGQALMLDGGLMSNLPVWAFDDERVLDPDALTIAVTLEPPRRMREEGPQARRGGGILGVVRTVIFGSAILDRRGVPSLKILTLPADMGLLDFDAPRAKVKFVVDRAAEVTRDEIALRIERSRMVFESACAEIVRFAEQAFQLEPGLFRLADAPQRLRACVFTRESSNPDGIRAAEPRILRLRYGAGFDPTHDFDDDIAVPIARSIVGKALRDESPTLHFTTGGARLIDDQSQPDFVRLADPADARRRRSIRRDLRWVLAVPIIVAVGADRPRREWVVALDGDGVVDDGALEVADIIFGLIIDEIKKTMYEVRTRVEGRDLAEDVR